LRRWDLLRGQAGCEDSQENNKANEKMPQAHGNNQSSTGCSGQEFTTVFIRV
jgi:hypothetical protein